MELFHIHLLGNHDRLYKPKKAFIVDKDKFNNRIYNRIYNMNPTVDVNNYRNMVNYINQFCYMAGIPPFESRINLGELISLILDKGASQQDLRKILTDAKEIILADGINLREMAMEEYRKQNCNNLPSRMHSLFACSEEGLGFWTEQIRDNDAEIFKLDVIDEPFLSNESLLPLETLNYGAKIAASYDYFHPKERDLNPINDEYLVQGKVRVLEKIDEIKRR